MSTAKVRIATIAGALLLAVAVPAQAQFGSLKDKLLKKTAPKEAPKEASKSTGTPGNARATAIIEWNVESVSNDIGELALEIPPTPKAKGSTATAPTTLTDKEHGRITIEFEFDPNYLPGGMVSRMNGSPFYMVGITTPAMPIGAERLVSVSGSVTLDRQGRPVGTCKRLGPEAGTDAGAWIDPLTLDASGKSEYNKENFLLSISFKGDQPVSFDFTRPVSAMGAVTGTRVTGKGSYACGSSFAVNDSLNSAGYTLAVREGAGWTIKATKATGGYELTGRSVTADSGTDSYLRAQKHRVVRTATLTWTAPPAPAQTAQTGNMAPPPKMEAAKGSITFTQKGKSATWPMQSVVNASQGGMTSHTLMYTPDGGQPSEEKGLVALAITNVMGQTMVGFNVAKGPGGDTEFEAGECTVTLKPSAGKAMSGSGECRKGGSVVTFTFSAGQ